MDSILRQLLVFSGLAKRKSMRAAKNVQRDASLAWAKLWFKLVLVFCVFAIDAEFKIHGWEQTVSWAMLLIPAFALLVLGNPTGQVTWTLIFSFMFRKERKAAEEGIVEFGLKKYWNFVATFILWSLIIAVGIKFIPIQYAQGAFWTFLPLFAIHEIAFWKEWDSEGARKMQRATMAVVPWALAACVLIPFVFMFIHKAEEHGYVMPTEDTAALTARMARNKSEAILLEKRTACVAAITNKVGKGQVLTADDEAEIAACNATFQAEQLSGLSGPAQEELRLATQEDQALREEAQRQCVAKATKAQQASGRLFTQRDIRTITGRCAAQFPPLVVSATSGGTDSLWSWIEKNPVVGGVGFLTLAHILPIVGIAVIGWFIYLFTGKKKDAEVTTVVKKDDTGGMKLGGWIQLLLVLAVVSYVLYTAYADKMGFPHLTQASAAQAKFPTELMSSRDVADWSASIVEPVSNAYAGKKLGMHFGKNIAERMNGGPNLPLVIEADQGGYVFDQSSVCSAPQTYSDGQIYSVCTGSWRHGADSGSYQARVNENVRVIYLSHQGSEQIVIKLAQE
jgi:uncharacterized membrane protein